MNKKVHTVNVFKDYQMLKRKIIIMFLFSVGIFAFFVSEVESAPTLDILIPTANEKITLLNVSVKGKVTPSAGLIGKINWETTVGQTCTTSANSDEDGNILISPFPASNSSFGNNTVKATADIDTTPPVITNLIPISWSYTNNRRPPISATYSDVGSGIDTANTILKLNSNTMPATIGANSVSYTPTSDLPEGLNWVDLIVKDKAGNTTTRSWSFYTDYTVPTGSIVLRDIITLREDWCFGTVYVCPSASDNSSGVAQLRFSNDNISWSSWENYSSGGIYSWLLSVGDGVKTVYTQFKDGAGNVSGSVSDTISKDSTPPPMTTDPSKKAPTVVSSYSNSSIININWSSDFASDPESGIWDFNLEVVRDDGYVHFSQNVGNVTNYNVPNCEHGRLYRARVKARNNAGLYSSWGDYSPWITVDLTPPQVQSIEDGNYTNNNGQLSCSWSFVDPESGVTQYWYAIGTTQYPNIGWNNIISLTSAGIVNNVIRTFAPPLSDGIYYFTAKARNGAGSESLVSSDGIIVDATPPAAPINLVGDGSNPSPWKNTTSYTISWSIPSDLSGIAGAYYKLGSAPQNNIDGTYTTSKPFNVTVSQEGSTPLYVWLKDNAGNIDNNNSSTVMLRYDIIPPVSVISQPEPNSWHSGMVTISGTAQDYGTEPSQLKKYTLSYCSTGWTEITQSNIPVVNGQLAAWDTTAVLPNANGETYTIKLLTEDNASNTSQATVDIKIDNTPPVISNLKVTNVTNNSATISWTTDDPSDTRIRYNSTLPLGEPIVISSEYTINHTVEISNLSAPGKNYYMVKSVNQAGLSNSVTDNFDTLFDASISPQMFPGVDVVSGIVTIQPYITNNSIVSCKLLINEVLTDTKFTPFTFTFDTKQLSDGSYNLTVIAVENTGLEFRSENWMIVNNAGKDLFVSNVMCMGGGESQPSMPNGYVINNAVGQAIAGVSNPANTVANLGSYNFNFTQGSDLYIKKELIDISRKEGPGVDEVTLSITANVNNIGGAESKNVRVRFFEGSSPNLIQIGSDQFINEISGFGSGVTMVQKVVSVTETPQTYLFTVRVDPNSEIPELEEGNNEAQRSITLYHDVNSVIISVIDQPVSDFSKIYLIFSKLAVLNSNGEWIDFNITQPVIDLQPTQEVQVPVAVGVNILPPGTYNGLKATIKNVLGVDKITKGIIPLNLLSSEVNINQNFIVKKDEVLLSVIDFDLGASITHTESGYNFLPTISNLIEEHHSFEINIDSSVVVAGPGQTGKFNINIENTGNVQDIYKLKLMTNTNEKFMSIVSSITIPAQNKKTVELLFNIPTDITLLDSASSYFNIQVTPDFPDTVSKYIPISYSKLVNGTLVVDNTPPKITLISPVGSERFVANISTIVINYIVTDNLDPSPTYYAYLTDLEEGTTIQVNNGQTIEPLSIDDGFWTLTVEATDWVGNHLSSTTAKFEVISDTTPPVVTDIVSGNITWNSTVINWITNEPSDSQVEYGLTTLYGNSTVLSTAKVTNHNVNITGLSPGTVYHYRVSSRDESGNLTISEDNTFTSDTNFISNHSFELGTSSWTFYTEEAGSFVTTSPGFDGSKFARCTIIKSTGNLQLYQKDIVLNPNTRYRLTFKAYSNTGREMTLHVFKHGTPYTNYGLNNYLANLTTSWQTYSTEFVTTGFSSVVTDARLMFWYAPYAVAGDVYYIDDVHLETVPPDTTPPIITSVASCDITWNSAVVNWVTNEPSDSQAEYGLTTSYGNSTVLSTVKLTNHSVNITGLTPGTVYHYRVSSRDESGNLAISEDNTFTSDINFISNHSFESGTTSWAFYTEEAGTFVTTSPGFEGSKSARCTIIKSTGNIQLYQTGICLNPNTRYRLTFTAYSNTGHDMAVRIFKHGTPYTNYGLDNYLANLTTSWQTYSTEFVTTGFSSVVNDARLMLWYAPYAVAGDVYYVDDVHLETVPADTTPPIITSVASCNITWNSAVVNWLTNEPGDSQVEYGTTTLYGISTTSDTTKVTNHSVNITGLTLGTTYYYHVASKDGSGNIATSENYTFSTLSTSSGTNHVTNAGFESGTDSWAYYAGGGGTFISTTPGFEGSKSAKCTITAANGNIQLYQTGICLNPNTRYRLIFTAYSPTRHAVTVHLLKHGTPYTDYGLNYTANLGTSWQTFTTEFITTGFTTPVTDGRFRFWFTPYATAGDTYYIDDVRLETVTGLATPPKPIIKYSNTLKSYYYEDGPTLDTASLDPAITVSSLKFKAQVYNTNDNNPTTDYSGTLTLSTKNSKTGILNVADAILTKEDTGEREISIPFNSEIETVSVTGDSMLPTLTNINDMYLAKPIGNNGGMIKGVNKLKIIVSENVLTETRNLAVIKTKTPAVVRNAARYVDTVKPISYDFGRLSFTNKTSVLEEDIFTKPISITIPYTLVDIGELKEEGLRIYSWNGREWELVPGVHIVDKLNKTITANVKRFTTYRILGSYLATDLSNVKVYPNPYKPNMAVGGKLKVINLPINSEMKIYTVSGELARELKEADFGNLGWLEWDGKNDDGDKVARGVYIYQIRDATGRKKTGKVGLIK
ncbi:MAG: carbohydrate binding domain-containing protein [Elusimicrobia bacterium]|nr:carbohydrate binding domain-containing protein [Elusimicrobiota bacterium]